MIHYDPHNWLDHFFDIRGSLVKEISLRVGVCVLWAGIVVVLHKFVWPVGTTLVLHTLVGVALGLLLVFRTNASYDRFWEGRRLWGGIVNETRNLVRSATLFLAEDPRLLHSLTRWTAVFPWAAMATLRGELPQGPVVLELSTEDASALRDSQHPGLYVAQRMTRCLGRARERGLTTDIVHTSLDQNIQLLVGYLGGCERIRKTPLPFAYVVHLRRALMVYCLTLPHALVEQFGWWTVLDVLLITYTFLGIEEIGVEIEGPFGYDDNDLPMEEICYTIRDNLYAMTKMANPERETLPEGL